MKKKISNAFKKVLGVRLANSVLVVILAIILMSMLATRYRIVMNHDGSLPINGVVIKIGKIPTKNDEIFVFNVKNNPHFKSEEIRFIKHVGGFAGNEIKVREREVYVADRPIGFAKTHSRKGAQLTITEEQVIPEHKFFAYTHHEYSFDSRYKDIGLVDEKDIIGTAILTF